MQITRSSISKGKLFELIVIVICMFSFSVNGQNICSSCISLNNTFLCNNIGCEGFILTQSQNNYQITSQINCINNQNCYYSPNAPNVKSVYYYLFCNYTFPGCSSCSNAQTCTQCQPGYYSQPYNTELALYNCKNCGEVIGGCEICYNGTFCQQCQSQYLNVFGLCYTTSGNIVGSTSKPWNKNGSTPTQIITIVQLFLLCLAMSFVFYRFCCKINKGQQKVNLNDTNQNYQQTYPNDKIEQPQKY